MKKLLFACTMVLLFTTVAQAQCKCATVANWLATEMKIGDRAVNKFKCGYQFTIKLAEKVVITNGGYNCISTTSCNGTYKVNIFKPGGSILQTLDPFTFTSSQVLSFPAPGTYKVELIAMCDNKSCKPCYYYFKVL